MSLRRLGGELLLQDLGAQLLPPQRVCRGQVARTLRVRAVDLHPVVTGEDEMLGAQEMGVERDLLAKALRGSARR